MKLSVSFLFLFVLFVGCESKDVVVYLIPKEAASVNSNSQLPENHPPIATEGQNASFPQASQPHLSATHGLIWTAPAHWEEAAGLGMRVASFKIKETNGPGAELSVIALAGEAGGPLANVNRWRGQLGLGDIDAEQLNKFSKTINTNVGPVVIVDFENDKANRMLAAILLVDGKSWFFKLTGTTASLTLAKDDFFTFLKSLKKA